MNYAKAFRVIRAAFGLSQAQLSDLLKIGPSHISLIESGKRKPSHKLIGEFAEVLKIPISLVTLLASEQKDLDADGEQSAMKQPIEALALSLLKLLVGASDQNLQPVLPFSEPKEPEK